MHWDAWQSTYNVNHQVSVASALIIYGKVRSCSYFHEHSVEKYTTQIWKLYRKLNFPTFFDCLPFTSCKRRQLLILSEGAIAGVIERFDDDVLLFLGTYMGFERRFFYVLKWLNVMQWKLVLRLLSIRNGLNWRNSYKKVIFDKTEVNWSNTRLQIIKLS